MGKTNANKVLGTFRKNYDDRKKSMMKSYMDGGITEEVCTGWPKRNCKSKKKFKSKGKRTTTNPRGGDGLDIGGNGELKKAFKRFGKKVKRLF